jgi:large subunit ribosomal protein L17
MRHGRKTVKLQRRQDHRDALLSNLVVSLVEHEQIRTTLAKAKALRPFAEKMVTLGKRGDLHARRLALGYLHSKTAVTKLFGQIAPAAAGRRGGYTRITKLGQRHTDSAPMAFIEWVDRVHTGEADAADAGGEEKKPAAKKKAASAKPKAKAKAKSAKADADAEAAGGDEKPKAKKTAKPKSEKPKKTDKTEE